MVDAGFTLGGLALAATGAGMIYPAAGFLVAGTGLFYLGALHR